MSGYAVARDFADGLGRFLLLVAIVIGPPAGLVLLDAGALAAVAAVLLLLLLTLFEGAYRTWDRSDVARETAQRALEAEHSRDALVQRLKVFVQECELLKAEVPADDMNPTEREGAVSVFGDTFVNLARRVERELRLYASGFLGYWRTSPPGWPPYPAHESTAAQKVELLDYSKGQLAYIIQALERGEAGP